MSDQIFIVILEDRHTDPEISVHRSRSAADRRFAKHMADYGTRYKWHERSHRTLSGMAALREH